MVFSSLLFLFGFFPAFFVIYYLTPARFRNAVALAGSLLFYCWGAPTFAAVLLVSCVLDFVLSQGIDQAKNHSKRKGLLIASLVLNLVLLGYFKYANFFVEQFNAGLQYFGIAALAWTKVVLPIGISFFTFHKISYTVDVYRGTAKPAKNLGEFLLYILIFPQLIAGPIIRYHDVADQLHTRRLSLTEIGYGLRRFCFGLGKKVLLANPLGVVADSIFGLPNYALQPSFAWLGILCYTLQLFFDFSGYSDMAIGLGRMLGFKWMENFDHPYIAQNFTDFWRRWHISLSRFMREYVYIPLGGNRVAAWRAYLNLVIVFALSGIWHGANWTFLVWGLYHGLFIVLDKAGLAKLTKRVPKFINILATFLLVQIGWVFFRSETITGAVQFIGVMFGHAHTPVPGALFFADVINARTYITLIVALVLSFLPAFSAWDELMCSGEARLHKTGTIFVSSVCALIIAGLAILYLVNAEFNPFIYFRF